MKRNLLKLKAPFWLAERKLNGSGSIGEIFISFYVMTETFDIRLIR